MSILNQLHSGLIIQFNEQDEYTIYDVFAFIQEEAQNIESFNRTYCVNSEQLLVDIKKWIEASQNDEVDDVAINIHNPASPTNK